MNIWGNSWQGLWLKGCYCVLTSFPPSCYAFAYTNLPFVLYWVSRFFSEIKYFGGRLWCIHFLVWQLLNNGIILQFPLFGQLFWGQTNEKYNNYSCWNIWIHAIIGAPDYPPLFSQNLTLYGIESWLGLVA